MNAVLDFFSEFDLFQAPATLRIRNQKQMKSSSIGFILFLISCFFVYIFISGCVNILKYENIDAQMSNIIIPQDQAIGYFNALAIRMGNFTIDEINTMFAPVFVTITLAQQYADENAINWKSMVPCTPEHWVSLGENYTDTFYYYGMNQMLCLNMTQPIRINETEISWTCTSVIIKFFMCNFAKTVSPNCNASKALSYLQTHNDIQISVYLLDTGFFPVQKVATKPFVNIDGKLLISWLMTTNLEIQYASYRVETDESLVSYASTSVSQGIWVNKISSYARPYNYTDDGLDLAKIMIYMNQNLRLYQRTIGKLDNLISYVGGLFQILLGFLGFFLVSFNEYRYELSVAEGAFDFDKNRKNVNYSDMSFITYIKYSIYEWINTLFCIKLKWKLCNDIEQIRDEIISLMEVNRFYKRIINAETAVTYALGEPKTDFIKLVQPPAIDKVNTRKSKIEYYDQVADRNVAYGLIHKIIETEQTLQNQDLITKLTKLSVIKRTTSEEEKSKVINKKNKKQVNLSPQLSRIERDFANSLLALNPRLRNTYEQKISPEILVRLKQNRGE